MFNLQTLQVNNKMSTIDSRESGFLKTPGGMHKRTTSCFGTSPEPISGMPSPGDSRSTSELKRVQVKDLKRIIDI